MLIIGYTCEWGQHYGYNLLFVLEYNLLSTDWILLLRRAGGRRAASIKKLKNCFADITFLAQIIKIRHGALVKLPAGLQSFWSFFSFGFSLLFCCGL